MDLKRIQNLVRGRLSVPGEVEHSVANIFIVSQSLTSVLNNPKNLCYGNAPWRCWCWTGSFAEDAVQAWGRSHQAVRQYLSDSEPQFLTGLQDMRQVWAQFGNEEQSDAADFQHSLWEFSVCTFFAGRFFHREDTQRKESSFLSIFFCLMDHMPSPGLCYISNPQPCRKGSGQNITESWKSPPGSAFLFCEDGKNVRYASYQIVGLVLHQGTSHETGHYQSILAIDNAYWPADDEA